jgi:hypothetical protein
VVPPSAVVTMAGPPSEVPPTAAQTETEGQEIPDRPTPAGTAWLTQVDPPSVVVTIVSPLAGGPRLATVKQSVTDGQEMAPLLNTPGGRLWVAQVTPPSEVVSIGVGVGGPIVSEPLATQRTAVTQETPVKSTPLGVVWLTQVAPPSVVVSTAPTPGPGTPTTTQLEAVAQETPRRSKPPVGKGGIVQVIPPLDVTRIAFDEIATQRLTDGHETPVSDRVVPGGVGGAARFTQCRPPSEVVTMAPSNPTATQRVAEGQETLWRKEGVGRRLFCTAKVGEAALAGPADPALVAAAVELAGVAPAGTAPAATSRPPPTRTATTTSRTRRCVPIRTP